MTPPQRQPNDRSDVDAYGLAQGVDASPEAAEADEQVRLSRVGIWIVVALLVVLGVVLYYVYRRQAAPLLG